MDDIDWKEIRRWIPFGRIQEIAKENMKHPNAASKIFSGKTKRPDMKFVNALLDEALKNKRLVTSKMQALKKEVL